MNIKIQILEKNIQNCQRMKRNSFLQFFIIIWHYILLCNFFFFLNNLMKLVFFNLSNSITFMFNKKKLGKIFIFL